MRLRSVIIDDEETGIETLRLLIDRYASDVNVVASATEAGHGIELIETYKPEIVFLDVSMPEMDGFELLEQLKWKNFNLIFTTAHQGHALRALKLNAIDYLLKPICSEGLCAAVERVKVQQAKNPVIDTDYSQLNNISQYYNHKVAVTSKNGVELIASHEIISMESQSNYTKLYLGNGRIIVTPRNLGEFDQQLCRNNLNFMRVHHSFIVNLHKVQRFVKDADDIIMINQQEIPLSKSRRESFFRWLNP